MNVVATSVTGTIATLDNGDSSPILTVPVGKVYRLMRIHGRALRALEDIVLTLQSIILDVDGVWGGLPTFATGEVPPFFYFTSGTVLSLRNVESNGRDARDIMYYLSFLTTDAV